MIVPFVDLKAQYLSIKSEVDAAVASIFEDSIFVGGRFVSEFERAFSALYEVDHCVGVGNGTDALFLILKVLGIGAGDEVITPALSWISTSETVSSTGAYPVFVDAADHHYTVLVNAIEAKINRKTKAVIVVHLYGQAAPIEEIASLCAHHNLLLIEDCSQAHLTEENNMLVGKFGVASAFSFYPTKNLGAYGEAGCVLTRNEDLALKVRRLANHGGLTKDEHLMEGTNCRLDSLQAAILTVKLNHLQKWTHDRIRNAERYKSLLSEVSEITLPHVRPNTRHSFHLFVIKATKRDALKAFLLANGVPTMIHYPTALPFEPAYGKRKHKPEEFPIAVKLSQEILSIPVYPELSEEQIMYVSKKIKEFYKK